MAEVPTGLRRWLGSGVTGVKVCGFTREEDAWAAVDAGVDALGFNFYSKSKRAVKLDEVGGWIAGLPEDVGRVAVVVQPSEELIRELVGSGIFHAIQFHGGEEEGLCETWGGGFYVKARAVSTAETAQAALADGAPCLLLDAYAPGVFGGTGRVIDWSLAADVVRAAARPVILSGGLTPENVEEAVRAVRPIAVDTASGVEAAPGIKDASKMKEFIAKVRQG